MTTARTHADKWAALGGIIRKHVGDVAALAEETDGHAVFVSNIMSRLESAAEGCDENARSLADALYDEGEIPASVVPEFPSQL